MRRSILIALGAGMLNVASCSDSKPEGPVDTTLAMTSQVETMPEQLEPVADAPPQSTGLMANGNPEFLGYVVPVYSGPTAEPIIGPDDHSFRTRIGEGAREKVNFAGNSVITTFGCGGGCLMGYIINLETGEVHPLGLGGEEQMYLTINARADSRLLIAGWESVNGDTSSCSYQRYVWDGSFLQPVGETSTVDAPVGECEQG